MRLFMLNWIETFVNICIYYEEISLNYSFHIIKDSRINHKQIFCELRHLRSGGGEGGIFA